MHHVHFLLLATIVISFAGCAPEAHPESAVEGRWYTHEQVGRGRDRYEQHCAVCHGRLGEGLAEDWKTPNANGNYPPQAIAYFQSLWTEDIYARWAEINERSK